MDPPSFALSGVGLLVPHVRAPEPRAAAPPASPDAGAGAGVQPGASTAAVQGPVTEAVGVIPTTMEPIFVGKGLTAAQRGKMPPKLVLADGGELCGGHFLSPCAYGGIYRGTLTRGGSTFKVAVKVCDIASANAKTRLADPSARLLDDLKSEAAVMRMLNAKSVPFVPVFHGFYTDGINYYLIMERVGASIDTLEVKITIDHWIDHWVLAQRAAFCASTTLKAMHSMGLTHNDVSLQNICNDTLNKNLFFYTIDFGAARQVAPGCSITGGYIAGKPYAVSQEAATGASMYSAAGDMFALGKSLLVFLTPRELHKCKNSCKVECTCAPCKGMMAARTDGLWGWVGWLKGLPEDTPGKFTAWVTLDALYMTWPACFDFLKCAMDPDAKKRLTAAQAVAHPWLAN